MPVARAGVGLLPCPTTSTKRGEGAIFQREMGGGSFQLILELVSGFRELSQKGPGPLHPCVDEK